MDLTRRALQVAPELLGCVLRVRGIDAQGLEGLSAERTLVVHTQPEPPLLMDPAPEAATTAQTDSTVTDFIIRFVVKVTEPQRSGIQVVFIRCGSGGNHRTIQLGMSAHCNVEATITGKHSGLFSNGVKAALHLIPGGSDVT